MAATPAALAGESDVVLVVVFNDAQVRAVLQGPDGVFAGATPGAVVVVISTIPTATLLELRAAGAEQGVGVLDCGVSGGPDASAAGELVCMIGGSAEEVERVRPVLDVISCLVLHMGPPGAGLAAKLARNLITYGSWLAAFEAQELAEAAGIDLVKLGEATRESDKRIGGASRLMFRTTVEPWPAGTDRGCSTPCAPGPTPPSRTWPPSGRWAVSSVSRSRGRTDRTPHRSGLRFPRGMRFDLPFGVSPRASGTRGSGRETDVAHSSGTRP